MDANVCLDPAKIKAIFPPKDNLPIIAAGDFNAKHVTRNCITIYLSGKYRAEALHRKNLTIEAADCPTHFPEGSNQRTDIFNMFPPKIFSARSLPTQSSTRIPTLLYWSCSYMTPSIQIFKQHDRLRLTLSYVIFWSYQIFKHLFFVP